MPGLVHAERGGAADDVGLVRHDACLDEPGREQNTRDVERFDATAVGREVERGALVAVVLLSIRLPKRMEGGLLPSRSRRARRCSRIS